MPILDAIPDDRRVEVAYARYRLTFRRAAADVTHCNADIEDAVHDVFAKLVVSGNNTVPAENVAAYLAAGVRRQAVRAVRKRQRCQATECETLARLADARCSMPGDERSAELWDALDRHLLEVPREQRRIFWYWLQGYTPTEIANRSGLSINTVKTHLRRAVKKLREAAERERERERERGRPRRSPAARS